ncbi:hypothetical protein ACFSTC_29265 [Nonomuraea ferruginea]
MLGVVGELDRRERALLVQHPVQAQFGAQIDRIELQGADGALEQPVHQPVGAVGVQAQVGGHRRSRFLQ